eukprot:49846_1
MAIDPKEMYRLESMKKELETDTKKLIEDRKKYHQQLKELKAEQIKVSTQKRELDCEWQQLVAEQKQISNHRNRAQTMSNPKIENKLRQEIKDLQSDSQITARDLRRTRSDLDAANEQIKILKSNRNTLNERTQIIFQVVDALKHEDAAVALDQIIQSCDKNEDDEEWKALKELSKMENDSSEFELCHQLLNEMALILSTESAHVQQRHDVAMQKIQQMMSSEDEGNNIQKNNQKWQQMMNKLRQKMHPTQETKQYVIVDLDLKRRLDRKRRQTVNNELEEIFTEILMNEGKDHGTTDKKVSIDAVEEGIHKSTCKCMEYDELHAQYSKLKEESALQAMFEHEYKKLLYELTRSKKMNQKQMEEHEEECNKMQVVYQMEYDKVLQELVQYKQIQDIKYNDLLSKYESKCKECEGHLHELSSMKTECTRKHREQINCKRNLEKTRKMVDTLKKEYETVQNEHKKTRRELTEYKHMQTEFNNLQSKHAVLQHDYDENKYNFNEMRGKYFKLERDYGALYDELNQTQSNQRHRIQQLEGLYQMEYTNLVKEFNEYKHSNELPEPEAKYEMEELRKQNKTIKQSQRQMCKIYESEYEKLLKEFTYYKQIYPPK